MPIPKDLVSEAAQTLYRDNETQFLEWDIADNPTVHPDKFYQGIGLHYPVLYDPAWPVHIAHKKKEKKNEVKVGGNLIEKKPLVPSSYALIGMTLREIERQPIKKKLLFPHRNTEVPFRHPSVTDVRNPIFELCEKFTLKDIDEIETRIILKSILQNLSNYDKSNKEECVKALQKLLNIRAKPQEKAPPFIKGRGKPKWRQVLEEKRKKSATPNAKDEPKINPQTIFVNDGLKCPIHGFSATMQKCFCPIHNVEEKDGEDGNKGGDEKSTQNEPDVDWCRICSGRNLHRKVNGEDLGSFPPAPTKPRKQDQSKSEEDSKGKDITRGPRIWCPVCKGFDYHRKVYEWPPRKEEVEEENESGDEGNGAADWCPMCQGYKVHRKLYGEDYNDYPNPPYKDPTKDKNYKGIYCPWCKGYNIHRQVYDWPSLA